MSDKQEHTKSKVTIKPTTPLVLPTSTNISPRTLTTPNSISKPTTLPSSFPRTPTISVALPLTPTKLASPSTPSSKLSKSNYPSPNINSNNNNTKPAIQKPTLQKPKIKSSNSNSNNNNFDFFSNNNNNSRTTTTTTTTKTTTNTKNNDVIIILDSDSEEEGGKKRQKYEEDYIEELNENDDDFAFDGDDDGDDGDDESGEEEEPKVEDEDEEEKGEGDKEEEQEEAKLENEEEGEVERETEQKIGDVESAEKDDVFEFAFDDDDDEEEEFRGIFERIEKAKVESKEDSYKSNKQDEDEKQTKKGREGTSPKEKEKTAKIENEREMEKERRERSKIEKERESEKTSKSKKRLAGDDMAPYDVEIVIPAIGTSFFRTPLSSTPSSSSHYTSPSLSRYPTTPSTAAPPHHSAPTTPSSRHSTPTKLTPKSSPAKSKSNSSTPLSPSKPTTITDYFKSLNREEIEKLKAKQSQQINNNNNSNNNNGNNNTRPVVQIVKKTVTTISLLSPPSSRKETQTQKTTTTTTTTTSETKTKTKPETETEGPGSKPKRKRKQIERLQPNQRHQSTQTQKQQHPQTEVEKKKTFRRPKVIDGRHACVLCGKTDLEATYEGKMIFLKKSDVYLHYECLYSASRYPDENFSAMIWRIAGRGRVMNCKHCKQACASVGCNIKTCKEVYHYKCAIEAGGKWHPGTLEFFCAQHYRDQNQTLIPQYKLLTVWPRNSRVVYLRDNIWDEITPSHRDAIARYARVEGANAGPDEGKWTVAWEHQDFTPRIKICEIGPGHWAWCHDLAAKDSGSRRLNCSRQFEAVAKNNINADEFIGEYVGRVRYDHPTFHNPYLASMLVPTNPRLRSKLGPSFAGLCIDSSAEGNETRFINSVSRQTPKHVVQNATMDTVWCRGQLRVIISAIRPIRKGAPIVLNYDEYTKDDGSHPYFDSESETEPEPTPTSYMVHGVELPVFSVVVPEIPAGYQLPRKKHKTSM